MAAWPMIKLPAAHSEASDGSCGNIPTLKKVNWYPKRRPSSDVRCPVKYHHSVLYPSRAQWSRGKDHG